MEFITFYFKEAFVLINEMSVYLLFGFLIAGVFHVFVPEKLINKYIGGNNLKSVINASLLGVPMPLCSCGVIPTGMSFYKNGASKGGTLSFLISTPQTGVDSIMVTYSLLGLPFAIIRPIVALFTGIMGGFLTNKFVAGEVSPKSSETNEIIVENKTKNLKVMLKYAFVTFLQDISTWLVVGIAIAAFISVIMPDNFFQEYISNDMLGMVILLIGAIPLYVCATGSVPIAMALMMKGLSPGAALVFLMAGPATNMATMTVVGKVMGKKSLIVYLISIIGGALLFGYLIDIVLPRNWFFMGVGHVYAHGDHLLPEWLKIASSFILIGLIINGYWLKYKGLIISRNVEVNNGKEIKINDMGILKIKVEGMNCNHCKANVEKNLLKVEGIKTVEVDLSTAIVNIDGENVDMEKVRSTVEGIGYKFVKEE